ncbi:hypothetical protein HOD83_01695 [Candidatus Woesearchaeota archaeon]|jgi:hypothetical protein|nr:hypothetical protein [Candidatus Woesearchaeota archaeon]MBT4114422.1 hypothetical protein [Candidatus Woesearchaeota archaeon]MBT4248285.1 hypothetical protein [Candidatus Woesearchaeota archaeon]
MNIDYVRSRRAKIYDHLNKNPLSIDKDILTALGVKQKGGKFDRHIYFLRKANIIKNHSPIPKNGPNAWSLCPLREYEKSALEVTEKDLPVLEAIIDMPGITDGQLIAHLQRHRTSLRASITHLIGSRYIAEVVVQIRANWEYYPKIKFPE